MCPPPLHPKIYHITHVDNLPQILRDGELYSDAAMVNRGGPAVTIGMSDIKQRRLQLPVRCQPGTRVGDYVPFNFCPRSVMLYVIHCANHPSLGFRGGQGPIIHLEADLSAVVQWADSINRLWAYSYSNAGAVYAAFASGIEGLGSLDWGAIENPDFRDPDVKERKQAEFLVHDSFPWWLIERIGVRASGIKTAVEQAIPQTIRRPAIEVMPAWYY